MKVLIRVTNGETGQRMVENTTNVDSSNEMLVDVVYTPPGIGTGYLSINVGPLAATPSPSTKPHLKIVKD